MLWCFGNGVLQVGGPLVCLRWLLQSEGRADTAVRSGDRKATVPLYSCRGIKNTVFYSCSMVFCNAVCTIVQRTPRHSYKFHKRPTDKPTFYTNPAEDFLAVGFFFGDVSFFTRATCADRNCFELSLRPTSWPTVVSSNSTSVSNSRSYGKRLWGSCGYI